MPRHMSFSLTTQQVYRREKTVTRRFGWWHLKPGDVIWAVEKAMGLKKGEKIKRICKIEIISTKHELACSILSYNNPAAEVAREGFPDMAPADFVIMLCKANGKKTWNSVNRIEFHYLAASEI